MTNNTKKLIVTTEAELTERVSDMSTAELLETYNIATNAMLTIRQNSSIKQEDFNIPDFDLNKVTEDECAEKETPSEPEMKDETPKPPKKATKKAAAKKAAKKKETKEEPEPKVEAKDEESGMDLDEAYEATRDAYDLALKKGVDSEQFLDVVSDAGFKSIDDVEDVSDMIKILEATKKLKKA